MSKLCLTLILLVSIVTIAPPACYGNSAEPPSILIIVPDAPEDLEIVLGSGSPKIKANVSDKIIERYYTFYSHELRMAKEYIFTITTGDRAFEILLEKPIKSYNNIFTLDLDKQRLLPGKLLSRSMILVTLRVVLTLLIEAAVFWIFGFKNKKSWIAFLAINLITQGTLNIWLNGFAPLASYIILTLIFGEIIVFLVETIAFLAFIREYSPIRIFLYVIIANFLSLFAGGYIITLLPI